MAERPILFNGEMVRAILDGRKTQTRRPVKPQPFVDDAGFMREASPFGVPGDTLWVRESFRLRADQDHKKPSDDWWKSGAWYEAGEPPHYFRPTPTGCGGGPGKRRPSIHMPRWASRLTLRVTDVRVERVQEISEEDAEAEGVCKWLVGHGPVSETLDEPAMFFSASYREGFAVEWESLYAKKGFGWDANPWVWAVSFEVQP